MCSLANIDYLKYAKKYGIKHRIIHSHNSQNMDTTLRGILHKINKNRIENYATDFWACSKDAAEWFYKKDLANKAIIIHNAIDVSKMKFDLTKRNEVRNDYSLDTFEVIGNVGRLHFQKNQEFIIAIFNELQKENKNYKLVLVGQGEDEIKLKQKVSELKLEESVIFTGVQSDIQAWLSAFDFFLFPSRFEGLSIAGLEAQANGLPVLCSSKVNPIELKVNDNFQFCSLENPIDEWKKGIVEGLKVGRMSQEDIMKNFISCGYDIHEESKRFERIMENL